ncbi:hypothetical protein [Bradyrhizobium sp. SBR1B]|uniref:hypothetical protein n=1 Tax=Bradyrhizobium sp. SBR1B TaxID=2663836 RepID=UPI001808BE18|nr:hypothetical protein [Bradyrhizobium sp. SBR1B]MBB4380545.1 hypothetical protein [Bradyrhizobium sp. SBR1B]
MLPFQKIALTASDYPRLEQLARLAAQQGDLDGIFLMGEINRAEIVPEESEDLASFVTKILDHLFHQLGRSSAEGPTGLARRVSIGSCPHFSFDR